MEQKSNYRFKLIFSFFFICFLLSLAYLIKNDLDQHFEQDDLNLDFNRRVPYDKKFKYYGLEYEEHKVTTDDGYILTLWRIFNSKKLIKEKKPVLINHGLLECSYTFIALDDKQSLPFILANDGYILKIII